VALGNEGRNLCRQSLPMSLSEGIRSANCRAGTYPRESFSIFFSWEENKQKKNRNIYIPQRVSVSSVESHPHIWPRKARKPSHFRNVWGIAPHGSTLHPPLWAAVATDAMSGRRGARGGRTAPAAVPGRAAQRGAERFSNANPWMRSAFQRPLVQLSSSVLCWFLFLFLFSFIN